MDLATFRILAPEFKNAPDEFVQGYLDAAAQMLNATEYGGAYDTAHRLLASHMMAVSPFGRMARMLNDKGESTYQTEFDRVTERSITPLAVMGGQNFILEAFPPPGWIPPGGP
jgi:uncharacterized protein DUF4054